MDNNNGNVNITMKTKICVYIMDITAVHRIGSMV